MTIGHDERHALLEQLDLLRARRREIEASLEVDDHRHDVGDQAEATERRDELDWIDRRIRDIVHLLWVAGLRDAVPERVGVGTLVRLRYTDGNVETVLVTAIPDEDIPEAFRYRGPGTAPTRGGSLYVHLDR
jgi:transcription elongation GreA/GreB family factor